MAPPTGREIGGERIPMTTFIVRYAEMALKKKNRLAFEKQLMANIRRVLGLSEKQVTRQIGQILVRVEPERADESREKLATVFGIAWFTEVVTCPNTFDAITETALEAAREVLDEHQTFAVRAARANKSLPFTSDDINRRVGTLVREQTGAQVNLSNPDVTIYISVRDEETFIYTRRFQGPGGLPVGTSGKVLSLISGGFDSIASSYLLARRGAQVDFLHFYVFPRKEGVLQTKMPRLWRKLSAYTLSRTVFLANFAPFQMAILGMGQRQQRYELVVFRRLMVRVGERLAGQWGYQALVLGDSLGQVASQTMENIVAVDRAVEIPIFRPLIGSDKVEVMDLVRRIGLEEEATAPYKDCCSIIAPHPIIRADLAKVQQIEEELQIEKVVDEIVSEIEPLPLASLPQEQ
ncbi:MAG TPA: tRNA 4-thiouridine(8) synthase ThiI [Chloroflexi bacterium]|nr:tRNA 4-thiouridine(8) synthase ThiI [Chloroflexota bacterium]